VYKLSPNWEECGPCPVFAFALQLRKKHRKNSVRVAEECQIQNLKRVPDTEFKKKYLAYE